MTLRWALMPWDLDRKDTRLADGARLTGTVTGMIVEQIRQTAKLLPRPDVGGPQRPELMRCLRCSISWRRICGSCGRAAG